MLPAVPVICFPVLVFGCLLDLFGVVFLGVVVFCWVLVGEVLGVDCLDLLIGLPPGPTSVQGSPSWSVGGITLFGSPVSTTAVASSPPATESSGSARTVVSIRPTRAVIPPSVASPSIFARTVTSSPSAVTSGSVLVFAPISGSVLSVGSVMSCSFCCSSSRMTASTSS